MDFNDIEKTYIENRSLFIESFGFFLMKVSRKDLPKLIELGLQSKNEIIYKKILNNIPFLLRKVKIGELGNLLNVLFEKPAYYEIIISDFKNLSKYFAPNNIEKVIQAFFKVNINSKIIADNLETFLENAKTKVQSKKIMESVKHIPKCEIKIKQYESFLLTLGDFHFLESLNVGTMMKLLNSGYLDSIKDIFIQYSNSNLKNVRFLASGFTSTVFSINDKVVKIGKERVKFNAQFSEFLLQPYLRKEFFDLEGNVIATVEVQDRCSTIDIDPKKAQEFIDSLVTDSNKFIWKDANPENLFVLLKDNTRKIPLNEDGFCYDNVTDPSPSGKRGDLVIGDTDFVYSPSEYLERETSYKTPLHKKTFSLILPTYNMEKYLKKCLDSILNQTCNDFEVLIINDGSTDNSLQIAEEYSSIDSRFKVLSFENGGLSTARNRGIARAQGEYILLIDPDDTIEPELLSKLKPYVEQGIETIRFGAIVQNDAPQKDKYRFNRTYYPEILSGMESLKRWNDDKRYSTAWLYCIKKEVYDRCKFQFPKVRIYEDVASIPKLIANSNSVGMLDYIGYNYIQHENTITNGKGTEKELDNLHGFITAYDFIKDAFNNYFSSHPYDPETEKMLLDGFFTRVETKFKHTNSPQKSRFADDLFRRHRLFKIDYHPEEYFKSASVGIRHYDTYTSEENPVTLKYKDTTISKFGEYNYNIDGVKDTIGLYKVEKEGQYNFTDQFLCLSDIDFSRIETDPDYKELVFKYLLSYSNLFLAESLNGSYIGNIKSDEYNNFSLDFNENATKFARNSRNFIKKLNIQNNKDNR